MVTNEDTVTITWSAPIPSPIAIARNVYANSSGSLMAVLYLTIDSAPTRPKERAKDDFTIVIITMIVIVSITKFLEKEYLFDKAFPYLTYTFDRIIARIPLIIKLIKNPYIEISELVDAKNCSKVSDLSIFFSLFY